MAFISFTFLKSYFYFLVFWILDLVITLIRDIYLFDEIEDPEPHPEKNENLKGSEFVYVSCLTLADLLAGFLVMRTNRKMKSINNQERQQKIKEEKEKEKSKSGLTQELIYNDLSIRNHKYSYLILISIIEFIARCTDLFYMLFIINGKPIRIGEVNWLISIDTFARIFFSKIILKNKLYKHHYLSIILILIGLFSMSGCAFKAIAEYETANWPYFLFIVAKYIILPFEDVINKILLTDEFLLPHYLMLWRGLFNFAFLIVLGLIVILPGWVKFQYFELLENDRLKFVIGWRVLYTILSFCRSFCLLKILDIFSPQHIAFSNTAFSIFQLIKCRTKSDDSKALTTIDFFFLLLIVFATLIFNEVVIINAFGLNKNTQKAFIKKANLELQDMGKSYDSDDEDNSGDEEDNKNENLNSTNNDENSNIIVADEEKSNDENNDTEKIDNQSIDS